MVKRYSGVGWHKAFLGETEGMVEIGIATAMMWKNPDQWKQMQAFNLELVGKKRDTVVLGKKSGRHSILLKAKELGLPIPSEEDAQLIVEKVKNLSEEKKGLLSDEEFKKLYEEVMRL